MHESGFETILKGKILIRCLSYHSEACYAKTLDYKKGKMEKDFCPSAPFWERALIIPSAWISPKSSLGESEAVHDVRNFELSSIPVHASMRCACVFRQPVVDRGREE
jgi:hypothetical protein